MYMAQVLYLCRLIGPGYPSFQAKNYLLLLKVFTDFVIETKLFVHVHIIFKVEMNHGNGCHVHYVNDIFANIFAALESKIKVASLGVESLLQQYIKK